MRTPTLTLEQAERGVQPPRMTAAQWHALHMAARNLPCVCLAYERNEMEDAGMVVTDVEANRTGGA